MKLMKYLTVPISLFLMGFGCEKDMEDYLISQHPTDFNKNGVLENYVDTYDFCYDTNEDGKVDIIKCHQITDVARKQYSKNPIMIWMDTDYNGVPDHIAFDTDMDGNFEYSGDLEGFLKWGNNQKDIKGSSYL